MKRFHLRALLYLIPLLIIALVVRLVDPYYLYSDHINYSDDKFKIGYGYDQGRRAKIFTYLNNPTDKIILGASEVNIINEHNIPEKGWHSLSYGGAPLQESLGTYWMARNKHKLSKVIIAPEFIKYYLSLSNEHSNYYYSNFDWNSSQTGSALDIYQHQYLYYTDKYALKSAWGIIVNSLIRNTMRGVPTEGKKQFWEQQKEYAEIVYSEDISESPQKKEIRTLFENIKKDAGDSTEIMILIPAQHTDLLEIEYSEPLYETYVTYIEMLAEIFGEVHYLGYVEGISDNRNAFDDPFHCNKHEIYIKSLFRGGQHIVLNRNNAKKELDIIRKKIFKNS